jgi:hypothetical protein
MILLPVSGIRAGWRPPTGHEDMALADSGPGLGGAVSYVSDAVDQADGTPVDAAGLPVGDLDLLVVARRRELRGDAFVAEGSCQRCATPVDVHFSLTAYARHHRPKQTRAATPAEGEPGWWRLRGHDVTFRLPTAADVLEAGPEENPRALLLRRCVREPVAGRAATAAEHAMGRLGPTLRAEVTGRCPGCAAEVVLDVDARELCLAELRFLAGSVYEDVHLIASAYGWAQDAILGLPSSRRRRYADLIGGRTAEAEVLVG